MSSLLQQRCLHHPGREAVARCPECRRYFCRECVVEHDDRLLCAACLEQWNRARVVRKVRWGFVGEWLIAGGSLMVGWMFFYFMGQALLVIPDAMHEGTIWREVLPEEAAEEAAEGGFAHPIRNPQSTHCRFGIWDWDLHVAANLQAVVRGPCSTDSEHQGWAGWLVESLDASGHGARWDHEPNRREVGTPGLGRPADACERTVSAGRPRPGIPTFWFMERTDTQPVDVRWSQKPGNAPRSAESQIPNPKSQIPNPQSDICPRFCLPASASCLARL